MNPVGFRINIDPVIFTAGAFALRWYSLLIIVAVVVGTALSYRAIKRAGLPTDPLFTLLLWAIPGGIVGSRLVHVIDQLNYYLANPGAIIGGEGQAIYGALMGGVLGAWIGSRVHRIASFSRILDLIAPSLPLAHSIGRVANIINGDATGAVTSLPWAFIYTNPNTYGPLGVPTHPSPVYEIMWNLVVFVILYSLRGRLKPAGSLLVAYLALYSLGRFFINFTRVNDPFLFGMHQAQVIALIVLGVCAYLLVSRGRLVRREASAQADAPAEEK